MVPVTGSFDGLIAFHYRDKLLRIDDTLSENDILTKFLSSGKNEQSLIKFLDEYGFLYRSSSDKYALYSCNELLRVINQVQRLVELIMEISKDTPALNIIAESLVQMMLSYPLKVHDLTKEGNPKVLYEAPEHPIRKYLTDIGALSINTNISMMIDEDPSSDYLYFVDEAFYTDHNYQLGELNDIELLPHLYFLELIFNDTSIESVEEKKGVILSNHIKVNPTDKNKKIIINSAKYIIKYEMDYHTKNISPVYDIKTMLGAWKIPNLFSAIYFSIFFLDHNFKMIKKCINPTCDGYYDVLHSNKKKIYCSNTCANIMSQRKYRLTHKKK